MRRLTVLYDPGCRLCCRARDWLQRQESWVELELLAAGSQESRRRFPELDHEDTLEDLTVISDEGHVWKGAKSWVLCLWALKRYRGRALAWSTPSRMALARRLVAWVSGYRHRLDSASWKST